ncbi:unnamed protein product [Lupinus luteus]|uniref:Uncharacterized protein n=1 Tax=Lupinus luteus TaxID=3873 RepID=A0AAV1VXU3_LUPLU
MAITNIRLNFFMAFLCIALILASAPGSKSATPEGKSMVCTTINGCPDNNACNNYCKTQRFPGGGFCNSDQSGKCCCQYN